MKRWKKILLWTFSVLVLLAVGGLFAANYAIDKVMNSMASSFEVDEPGTEDSAQGEVTEPAVAAGDATVESSLTVAPTDSTQTGNGEETSAETAATATSQPGGAGASTSPNSSPKSDRSSDGSSSGYTPQVSADKAKDIQDDVTVKDKADVASILLGQLSMSDIKRLQELASGGLTIEEKREARSIILGKVSEEQYNELSQVAKKYGVSQGKSRDQILEEEKQIQAQEQQQAEEGSE